MKKNSRGYQKGLSKNISFLGGGNRFTVPKCMVCKRCLDDETKMRCEVPDEIFDAPYEEECNKGIKFKEMK